MDQPIKKKRKLPQLRLGQIQLLISNLDLLINLVNSSTIHPQKKIELIDSLVSIGLLYSNSTEKIQYYEDYYANVSDALPKVQTKINNLFNLWTVNGYICVNYIKFEKLNPVHKAKFKSLGFRYNSQQKRFDMKLSTTTPIDFITKEIQQLEP